MQLVCVIYNAALPQRATPLSDIVALAASSITTACMDLSIIGPCLYTRKGKYLYSHKSGALFRAPHQMGLDFQEANPLVVFVLIWITLEKIEKQGVPRGQKMQSPSVKYCDLSWRLFELRLCTPHQSLWNARYFLQRVLEMHRETEQIVCKIPAKFCRLQKNL